MKVVVWGINYRPEVTGIAPCNAALCDHLRAAGHEARMVTTFPYYPAWRKRPEDAGRLYRTDVDEGVPVHRCWHYVPRRATAPKRIVHELTFVVSSLLRVLSLPRPDVYVVVSPPLLLGAAAWLAGAVKRAPFVFHVQDLQPDAAVGLGMLRPGLFSRALYALEAFAYRTARLVSGISPAMTKAFGEKGVPEGKRVYFPNGVEIPEAADLPARGGFRRKLGFGDGDFLAVYSGNLGMKQGLRVLLEAALRVRDPRLRIVVAGEGAFRPAMEAHLAAHPGIPLRLIDLQPEEVYREMLADADVCLIPQQAGSGDYFLPSKLLRILALGRPVLACTDAANPLAAALEEGGFGLRVGADDAEGLARALDALAADPGALDGMGERGRRYVGRFSLGETLAAFVARLKALQ